MRAAFLVLLATQFMGCAKLMAELRKEFDDSGDPAEPATVGGSWTERGMLSDEEGGGGPNGYARVGHSERGPASQGYYPESGGSWISRDQADANSRDLYRQPGAEGEEAPVAMSNTPVVEPRTKRMYRSGNRVTQSDFVDESQNEGSLWASDGQTNYYFTKNKIRTVGDIVTLNLEQDLIKDALMEMKKRLTLPEREQELYLAQERLRMRLMGIEDPLEQKDPNAKQSGGAARGIASAGAKKAPAAPTGPGAPEEEDKKDVDVPVLTYADVDISRSVGVKSGDTMMAEIVERYPNGNYKVRGAKKVAYRTGPRMMTVTGIVRGTDISDDDIINSGKMYEYRLDLIR